MWRRALAKVIPTLVWTATWLKGSKTISMGSSMVVTLISRWEMVLSAE